MSEDKKVQKQEEALFPPKVVLCGEHRAGKSELLERAISPNVEFDEKYNPTQGLKTKDCSATVSIVKKDKVEKTIVEWQFWDVEKIDKAKNATNSGCFNGAVAVCCITADDAEWKNHIDEWKNTYFQNKRDGDNAQFILVATKCDITPNHLKEMQDYAKEKNITFFSSSAKNKILQDGKGIEISNGLSALPSQLAVAVLDHLYQQIYKDESVRPRVTLVSCGAVKTGLAKIQIPTKSIIYGSSVGSREEHSPYGSLLPSSSASNPVHSSATAPLFSTLSSPSPSPPPPTLSSSLPLPPETRHLPPKNPRKEPNAR